MFNKKLHIKTMAILALGLIVAAAPLLQTHSSAALSASSISKTEGLTAGGDEIIIKGEGFIKDRMDGIWEIIEFQLSACKSSESLALGSSIIITKSGLMFEQAYDDDNRTLVNLTEEYDLGIIDSIHDTGSEKIIHTKDNRLHVVSYMSCATVPLALSIDAFSPGDSYIVGEDSSGGVYIKSGDEYYLVDESNSGAYPRRLVLNEPVVSVDGNILTMQSGKKIIAYKGVPVDLTNYIGQEAVVYDDGWSIILSSGKMINYDPYDSEAEVAVSSRFVELLNGEDIQQIFGNIWGGTILTKSGKLFTILNDWDSGSQQTIFLLDKIDTPSDVDEIVDDIIYLKDGTIFGAIDLDYGDISAKVSEQFSQIFEEDRIVRSGLPTPGYANIVIAGSGKIYVVDRNYDAETDEEEMIVLQLLDYELSPGDNISSYIYDDAGGITMMTDFGEAFSVTFDGSFKVADVTAELTKGLPTVPTNQVMRLYFGGMEATNFEIIDANTIRAIVPANNTGLYNISFLARGSSAPHETSLNYRYTGSNNGSGGGSNSEGGLPHITAPNTGYRRS